MLIAMNPVSRIGRKCYRWIGDRVELAWFRLKSKSNRGNLGVRGERAAARFLSSIGMIVVERNCRSQYGEIDLIAVDSRTIVFVEVKTRQTDIKGSPLDAIDDAKQRQITGLAVNWLKLHNLLDKRFRFDAVAVVWPDPNQLPVVKHYESVFEPSGFKQFSN